MLCGIVKNSREKFKIGETDDIRKAMRNICERLQPICKKYFPNEYETIINGSRYDKDKLYEMGGREFYMGQQMYFTRDYINSSHIDFADQSPTIAFWVEENVGEAEDWNFVYPNVRINEHDGLMVKLQTGLMMAFQGDIIRHCSTVGELGNNNHVYGMAFVHKK